jgi:hypothetical protein
MAKRRRRKGSKALGFSPDRWTVFNVGGTSTGQPCSRKTYTSYGDAAKSALRCSKNARNNRPCLLLAGWSSGPQRVIGRCYKGRCSEPKEGDKHLVAKCGTGKKLRRSLIAARARARNMGPSQASKSGMRYGKEADAVRAEAGLGRRKRRR